uniref:Uncharacterized protein n=1 Tax=Oryza brachyantha TaxID=4533 RepID=J3L0D9_ORYBR
AMLFFKIRRPRCLFFKIKIVWKKVYQAVAEADVDPD